MTAAAIWGIVEEWPACVDVTIVGRDRRARPGVRVHRTGDLGRSEIRIRAGLPVTAPERTLLDLAAVLGRRHLARALNDAQVLRLLREPDLLSLLDRFSRRRGTRTLRTLLETRREPAITRSEAERRMLELIERAELPRPRVNVRVAGCEIDLLWPDERLVIEVDGYAFHSSPSAFERDRRRDAELTAAGYRVLRITWRQIVDEPEATAVRLARVL